MILICLFAKSHKYIFLSLSAVDYYYLYLKVNKITPVLEIQMMLYYLKPFKFLQKII